LHRRRRRHNGNLYPRANCRLGKTTYIGAAADTFISAHSRASIRTLLMAKQKKPRTLANPGPYLWRLAIFFTAVFGMPLVAQINPQVWNRCSSGEPQSASCCRRVRRRRRSLDRNRPASGSFEPGSVIRTVRRPCSLPHVSGFAESGRLQRCSNPSRRTLRPWSKRHSRRQLVPL
jgi:hypothetical protein